MLNYRFFLYVFQVTGRLRATGYGFVICDVGLGFFAICGICVMISLFWSVCPRLQPKAGVISGDDPEIPLLKWVGPKRLKEAQDLADVADVSECVGYAAAVDDRSKAMESKGLQTSLPTLSKEQRKIDKERKKALSNAKHLLK